MRIHQFLSDGYSCCRFYSVKLNGTSGGHSGGKFGVEAAGVVNGLEVKIFDNSLGEDCTRTI